MDIDAVCKTSVGSIHRQSVKIYDTRHRAHDTVKRHSWMGGVEAWLCRSAENLLVFVAFLVLYASCFSVALIVVCASWFFRSQKYKEEIGKGTLSQLYWCKKNNNLSFPLGRLPLNTPACRPSFAPLFFLRKLVPVYIFARMVTSAGRHTSRPINAYEHNYRVRVRPGTGRSP